MEFEVFTPFSMKDGDHMVLVHGSPSPRFYRGVSDDTLDEMLRCFSDVSGKQVFDFIYFRGIWLRRYFDKKGPCSA